MEMDRVLVDAYRMLTEGATPGHGNAWLAEDQPPSMHVPAYPGSPGQCKKGLTTVVPPKS